MEVMLVKALGYLRCSTAEQAIDGLSLEAQRGRIDAWCQATGAELVEVIEDAGISGTRSLADRPGGARIASLLTERSPDVDTVVVARLDRLGRDASETLSYLRQFAKGSVGLVSIADRIDLGTPQGRAMAQMSAVFAELERALVAQRTSDALTELRSRGQVYGSVPYGFRREGERLVMHDDEQGVLARMGRLRSRGKSYDRIARVLNSAGVPAKRGGRWHAMSVRSVLLTAPKVGRPTEAAV
ncbi:MAG: recombinase family protein [Solirubrobacteraceae bacterium]